jgi:hypothetical protein
MIEIDKEDKDNVGNELGETQGDQEPRRSQK